ncbi:DNA methylase N-4/N-6 [Microcystis phage Mae-JY24]
MSLPKPYYDQDGITIYHGDCREILPHLPQVDLVLTDPPYGRCLETDYSSLRRCTRMYRPIHGDSEVFDPSCFLKHPCLFFGANHFAHRLPPGTWHVWDKRETAKSNLFADFEVWWTSWKSGPSRIFRYQWVCGVHPGSRPENIKHPTVKPLPLMIYVMQSAPSGVVLDPFMGSGTTLVAAKQLGRRAIGIEIDEEYCRIAVERLAQGNLFSEVASD